MLMLLEGVAEKRRAHAAFKSTVLSRLKRAGRRNIGYPSGNADETVYTDGDGGLWAAFAEISDGKVPRNWNAFGVFKDDGRSLAITVELNVPTTTNSARVAGFFASHPESGAIYLMHDGSVGGGKKGVGRDEFLQWSSGQLVPVTRSQAPPREGIVIGRIDDHALVSRIWRFVRQVRDFKDAVAAGEFATPQARKAAAEWDQFRSERGGRRTGRRSAEIDYISYHADVVAALRAERERTGGKFEKVLHSRLIDLMVNKSGHMKEIYEVKTGIDRQSIYTGIGQLMVHSSDVRGVRRILVLPVGPLPVGIDACLTALGVKLRRYRLTSLPDPTVQLM